MIDTSGSTIPGSVANGGTGVSTTSQNQMFAGPTGGSGAPAFRLIVAGDFGTRLNLQFNSVGAGTAATKVSVKSRLGRLSSQ
jgi:hypothetical protein